MVTQKLSSITDNYANTQGKYPFWALTKENPAASYICINPGCAYIPEDIRAQGVGLEAGIETVLEELI